MSGCPISAFLRPRRDLFLAVATAMFLSVTGSVRGADPDASTVPRRSPLGDAAPAQAIAPAPGRSTQERIAEIGRRADLQEFRGFEVERVRIEGIDGEIADPLRKGLELSGDESLLGRERARFYPPTLSRDLERARLFLAREGYPRAVLAASATLTGEERVEIRIQVVPGPAVRVSRIEFRGFPAGDAKEAENWVGIRRGERFRDLALDVAVLLAESRLANEGYARARVRAEVAELDSGNVAVIIEADPGPVCTFSEVRIEGTDGDLVVLARRTVGIDRGDRYASKRLDRAQDQLRLLGLFRQIRFELQDAPGFDRSAPRAELDLVVHLADRPARSLETGVGYWSEDLLRVQGRWQHRNLFQRGRGLEFAGLFSSPRREVESSVWWPALFRADLRGQLAGRVAWQYEEAFRARRRGGDLVFLYRPTVRSTIRLGLEIERVTIVELGAARAGETRETQFRLAGQWSFDNTDDRVEPSRGQLLTLAARAVIPTGLAKNEFVVYEFGLSQYLRLAPRTVLALRGNAGWAEAAVGELPAIYRFFAGGATSMRGYRRGRLGPLDVTNTPTGGEAKLELGGELRFPIWKGLRGAAFFDAAQVWTDRRSVHLADLATAAGSALIWSSPVGPVRLDVGIPIEAPPRETDDPRWVLHVLVGHPF